MNKKDLGFSGRGKYRKMARWGNFNKNLDIANKIGVNLVGGETVWMFDFKEGVKAHFYPTKNRWRIDGGKCENDQVGFFDTFWDWYNKNKEV